MMQARRGDGDGDWEVSRRHNNEGGLLRCSMLRVEFQSAKLYFARGTLQE